MKNVTPKCGLISSYCAKTGYFGLFLGIWRSDEATEYYKCHFLRTLLTQLALSQPACQHVLHLLGLLHNQKVVGLQFHVSDSTA